MRVFRWGPGERAPDERALANSAVAVAAAVMILLGLSGCGPAASGSGEKAKLDGSTTTTAGAEQVGETQGSESQPTAGDVAPGESAGVSTANEEAGTQSQDATEKTTSPANPSPAGDSAKLREITFEDINLRIQADIVFRPWMINDAVKALDGQRVRIAGFMLPGAEIQGVKEFVLLRNTECKFGPGGQADHLIMVTMKKGETTAYQTKPVAVEGILKINPFKGADGNTWSIYDLLEAENVSTVRR